MTISILATFALAIGLCANLANAACPDPENLVANCGFEQNLLGYTPQVGDVIAHEPVVGDATPGSMRVSDGPDPAGDAEAEACIDLETARTYVFGASYRMTGVGACLFGWDEYPQAGCTGTRQAFNSSGLVGVGGNDFTRITTSRTMAADIQSIELVILCTIDGFTSVEFLVDDVFVQPQHRIFDDGFEELP